MSIRNYTTRETFSGGYEFAIRRIDREDMDEIEIGDWLWRHYDTPRSERGQFWHGVRAALTEKVNALESAMAQ